MRVSLSDFVDWVDWGRKFNGDVESWGWSQYFDSISKFSDHKDDVGKVLTLISFSESVPLTWWIEVQTLPSPGDGFIDYVFLYAIDDNIDPAMMILSSSKYKKFVGISVDFPGNRDHVACYTYSEICNLFNVDPLLINPNARALKFMLRDMQTGQASIRFVAVRYKKINLDGVPLTPELEEFRAEIETYVKGLEK